MLCQWPGLADRPANRLTTPIPYSLLRSSSTHSNVTGQPLVGLIDSMLKYHALLCRLQS